MATDGYCSVEEWTLDFIDSIRELANRIPRQIDHLQTEEATKHALVMPFINAMGYNVFDPTEVIPEFTADEHRYRYSSNDLS